MRRPALLVALALAAGPAAAGERAPSLATAFAAVYGHPRQAVTWEGQRHEVTFRRRCCCRSRRGGSRS